MKLINADKYKKDIEHYRNVICYQRNVTMDDCMRILDKQENVLNKLRDEINEIPSSEPMISADGLFCYGSKSISMGRFREKVFEIIDRYRNEVANETDS